MGKEFVVGDRVAGYVSTHQHIGGRYTGTITDIDGVNVVIRLDTEDGLRTHTRLHIKQCRHLKPKPKQKYAKPIVITNVKWLDWGGGVVYPSANEDFEYFEQFLNKSTRVTVEVIE